MTGRSASGSGPRSCKPTNFDRLDLPCYIGDAGQSMQRLSSILRSNSLLRPPVGRPIKRAWAPERSAAHNFRFRQTLSTSTTTTPLSASMSGPPEQFGNFDLIRRVKVEYTDVVISKWKSRETGLSVVHLDYEGVALQSCTNHSLTRVQHPS